MGVGRPEEINTAFAAGFNARDVDALVALYDPDGCVVERDGGVSAGEDAVRAHLTRLLAVGGEMTSTNRSAIVIGDTALVTAEWEIVVDDAATAPITGRSAEVLRIQPDGTWAYLIDQPLRD
jgi:uncharacterized protein (TIGR02246 family)